VKDIYSAENKILKALPKMAKPAHRASCDNLEHAFEALHLPACFLLVLLERCLQHRRACKGNVGSNPTPSVRNH
jgi:ferritin-like metal-binding protein YciE